MSALILKAANEFSTLFLGTSRSDDSSGDRLSYRYTTAILIAFTVIVSNREFTSKRIQCWVPAFFTGNYEDYTNNVCWVRNTYYIDDSSEIPESTAIRQESSIRYYQWIPFILLFQAFLFFIPYVLWRVLCQRSGIDIRDIVEAATSYKKSNDDKQRQRLMNFIVSVIDQYCDDPRRQSNNRETVWWNKCLLVFFPSSGRYLGDYLRNLFLFIKFVYALNAFFQIVLLSLLLGQPFWSLGATVLKLLYEGKGWDFTSRYFPKVTLCDFQIREANALPIAHTYTVMCVLPVNLFNQQIFTFLWFWFVLVIFFTVYDFCIWIFRLFFRRETYLHERLNVMDYEIIQKWPPLESCKNHVNPQDIELIERLQSQDRTISSTGEDIYRLSDGRKVHHQSRMFIVPPVFYRDKGRTIFDFFNSEYLEADGHFIIRIIGTNASEFVAVHILHELYKLCCQKRFSANPVRSFEKPQTNLVKKYLVIDKKDPEQQPPPQTQQPRTPNIETRPTTNPFQESSSSQQAPEIKRRTVHQTSQPESQGRSRSGTLPFVEHTEELQTLSSARSGNGSTTKQRALHPKYDQQIQEQEEHQDGQ